jgi:membrane protease YdiL (CAAX protease family)
MTRRRTAGRRGPDWTLVGALAAAYLGFARAFSGPKHRFFATMTRNGAALSAIALSADPTLRRLRISAATLAQGAAIAGPLYGAFWVGDRVARRVLPGGGRQIAQIYGLRQGHDPVAVGARLALVIGPSEELFWRGLVQRRLSAVLGGEGRGALAATAAYAGAHVVTGNPTLVLAAAVAGAWWSALAARGIELDALAVSHAVWDVLVFLVAPTSSPSPDSSDPSPSSWGGDPSPSSWGGDPSPSSWGGDR